MKLTIRFLTTILLVIVGLTTSFATNAVTQEDVVTFTIPNGYRNSLYELCRDITYYKSNNGGSAQRPNNTIQVQALQNLKDFAQQKEQDEKNDPEWINGIWAVNTTVSTAMGPMRVNAKVCIDRKNQQLAATDCGSTVARGIYRISGNTIHCGDLYIEMDISNERLEYGNGVYYRKVSDKYL